MGNLMKIYCVSRSASSFRLASETTTYLSGLLRKENPMLPQVCEVEFSNTKPMENETACADLHNTTDKLLDYGRKLVTEFIQQNAPVGLQNTELLRVFKSALGLSEHYEKCSETEGDSSLTLNDKDSISSVLWHVAEERWQETAEKLALCKPEKMLHGAVELLQERIKDVMANSSLISQMLEAGDYVTAKTQSIRGEAEVLSHLLCDRRDHTITSVTQFWKSYCENHTTLETLYSLVNDCVLSHVNCEGMELFSEYFWTMKPEFNELDLLEANHPQIDDDGFHFMVEERVPRRSILFVGAR